MLKKLCILSAVGLYAYSSQENHEQIIAKADNRKKTVTKNALDVVTTIKPLQLIIQAYFSDWLEIERLKLRYDIDMKEYLAKNARALDNYNRYEQLFGERTFAHALNRISRTHGYYGRTQIESPDNTREAIHQTSIANKIQIRERLSKNILQTVESPIRKVTSMSFSSDNKFLAAGIDLPDKKKTIKVWDLNKTNVILSYDNATWCDYVACSPDGSYTAFCGSIGSLDEGESVFVLDTQKGTINSIINGCLNCIAFSANNKYCVTQLTVDPESYNQDVYLLLLKKTELEYEEPVSEQVVEINK